MTNDETPSAGARGASAGAGAGRVRLDKWLWAARFFKTRALAVEAIDGGKVKLNGAAAKRAKLVGSGDSVRIRLGPYEHDVLVREVSERRGPAAQAALLYEETPASREARERLKWQLDHAPAPFSSGKGRPTKRDRRDLERWQRGD
jgi:ribosome-associated heat shock protein Hsp15